MSEWDEFSGAAERYADVLGKDGLAEYRRLAEAQWSEVPARGPGADPDRLPPRQSHRDFTLTRMMESLARAQGDVDGLIEIMSRDRSSAYRFLELAQVCRGAGRLDEALEWAERGVEAFRVRTDRRLVEFLTRAYLEHERGDDAVALAWRAFEERPDLESYQVLKQTSESIGAWAAWRPRVLERVRSAYRDPVAAGTTLVTIHEREAEHDAAWNAAHELGCERVVLSRLAKRTEDTHPGGHGGLQGGGDRGAPTGGSPQLHHGHRFAAADRAHQRRLGPAGRVPGVRGGGPRGRTSAGPRSVRCSTLLASRRGVA